MSRSVGNAVWVAEEGHAVSQPRPFDVEQHKRWVRGLWWVLVPGYVGVVAWLIWRIAAVLRS